MIQTRNKSSDLGKNLRLMIAKSQSRALKAVKEKTGSFPTSNQEDIYKKLHISFAKIVTRPNFCKDSTCTPAYATMT